MDPCIDGSTGKGEFGSLNQSLRGEGVSKGTAGNSMSRLWRGFFPEWTVGEEVTRDWRAWWLAIRDWLGGVVIEGVRAEK
jgi:hypothetical protein